LRQKSYRRQTCDQDKSKNLFQFFNEYIFMYILESVNYIMNKDILQICNAICTKDLLRNRLKGNIKVEYL